MLEYRTPVIKASPEAAPQTTPVPGAIFTGSLAGVSFMAGMLVDTTRFICRCIASISVWPPAVFNWRAPH